MRWTPQPRKNLCNCQPWADRWHNGSMPEEHLRVSNTLAMEAAKTFEKYSPPVKPWTAIQWLAMDWSKTNDKVAVQMLLEMIYDHNLDDAYPDGMRCFRQHRPDLFAAFQLQASLFNGADDAQEYTQAGLGGIKPSMGWQSKTCPCPN